MIRRSLTLAALALLAPTLVAAESPRVLYRHAVQSFEEGAFAESAEAFSQAAEAAEDTRLDPAVAYYNRGKALSEAGDLDQAAELFTQALRTSDLRLQQNAYHNRGNSLVQKADQLEQGQDLEAAMSTLREAQTMFAQAIALDPEDKSPKVNYELAARRLKELEEQQEQQQQEQEQEQQEQNSDDPQDQEEQEQPEQDPEQQEQDQQDPQEQQEQDPEAPNDQDPQPEQDEQQQDGDPPPQQEPRPSEEMTPEEAEMMLDAIREEEEAGRKNVRIQFGQSRPVEKDW